MNWLSAAMEGVKEEIAHLKKRKLKDRIENCNRPFYWYDPIQKQVRSAMPTCKHWTCEYCNTVRAGDEQDRTKRVVCDHGCVYILREIIESQWPKLARQFKSAGVTKNLYRRLPQDDNKLVVFFVGSRSLARELKAESLYNPDDLQEEWYDLARKRPNKRTSGNLGQAPEEEPTGPELTSVKVESVRSNTINGAIHAAAIAQANKIIGERQAQDKDSAESLIIEWADAYESFIQDRGHETYRLKIWRKMDLTALPVEKERIAVKPTFSWLEQALAGVQEELAHAS